MTSPKFNDSLSAETRGVSIRTDFVDADIRALCSIGQIGLSAAFRTAERTPEAWLFECRLAPLTYCHLALAENVGNPPKVSKAPLSCLGWRPKCPP